MELAIKLYNDKPPRIGIVYPNEYQGRKAYDALMDQYRGQTFNALFEPVKDKVKLTLFPRGGTGIIQYKDLDFKPDQLKKLFDYIKSDASIQFTHIYWQGNAPFIAKNRYKPFEPLIIQQYEIVGQ